MPVTARQRQVYDYICRYTENQKQPPTIAEIGKQFQMTSSASVHSILRSSVRASSSAFPTSAAELRSSSKLKRKAREMNMRSLC